MEELASYLSIAVAVVSSCREKNLPSATVLIGELGLGGQLRSVAQIEQRLLEAERLGFARAILPRGNAAGPFQGQLHLELLEASNVSEAIDLALSG